MTNADNSAPPAPPPVDSNYTWADLPTVRPSIEECKKVVQKWASSAPCPFAGMPRLSDIGFDKRFLKAYQDICAKLEVIAKEPTGSLAMGVFGALNVMAAGFADNLEIDGQPFSAGAGPKHVFRGFAALVAGRYRQERESEEGRIGLAEVAKIDARFGEDGCRPTAREVDAFIDHQAELEHK